LQDSITTIEDQLGEYRWRNSKRLVYFGQLVLTHLDLLYPQWIFRANFSLILARKAKKWREKPLSRHKCLILARKSALWR
jgi:hypothetical protein